MRFLIPALALASALACAGDAVAGVVIQDRTAPFRTQDVRLEQALRSSDGVVPAGLYVVELAPKVAATKSGVVIHDLVGRLYLRDKGALTRKGEIAARLQVDDALFKQQGVSFAQLGFKEGHKVIRTERAGLTEMKLEGAPGVSIQFSIAYANP